MGMLSFVPYVLLTLVAMWLVWPVFADPIRRRMNRFPVDAQSPDGVADALFGEWSDQADPIQDHKRPA